MTTESEQQSAVLRFRQWCIRHGAGRKIVAPLAEDVLSNYSEPHRHYHNLQHILSSLYRLDQLERTEERIEGAIWFHDVIYDPTRNDNEAKSIDYFEDATSDWLDPVTRRQISRLIEVTDPSIPCGNDPSESLMVDIDLAILAADPCDYERYRKAIRQEYEHVTDEDFIKGRTAILQGFLSGRIFRTKEFTHLDPIARDNIREELNQLRASRS